MAQKTIELDVRYDQTYFDQISREMPKAASSTLNDTAKQARTQLVKGGGLITSLIKVKTKELRDRIYVRRKASKNLLEASIGARKKPRIPLIQFTKRKQPKNPASPVVMTYYKGLSKVIPKAFIQTGVKSQQKKVFMRIGEDRYPIKTLKGVSVAGMVRNTQVEAGLKAFISKKLPEILARKVAFFSRKTSR